MDETAIDAKGAAPLDPLLKKIAALSSVNDLAPLVAELHTIGVNAFFSFGSQADFKDASVEMAIADQGGLGLPDRDYYFTRRCQVGGAADAVRRSHRQDVGAARRRRGRAGEPSAQQVMKIETALAKGALDAVSRRDPNKIYHKMSTAELQALTPQFMWPRYFSGIGSPPIYALNVTEPDFFKAFGQIAGVDAARRDQGVPALARRARLGADPVEAVRRRELPLLRHARSPAPRSCGRAGSAACSTPTTISAKRSARRSSRRRSARRPRPTR